MFIHVPYFSKIEYRSLCDKFYLDSILGEGVKLSKSIDKFRYGSDGRLATRVIDRKLLYQ